MMIIKWYSVTYWPTGGMVGNGGRFDPAPILFFFI